MAEKNNEPIEPIEPMYETEEEFLQNMPTLRVIEGDDAYYMDSVSGNAIPRAHFSHYYRTPRQGSQKTTKTITTNSGTVLAAPGGRDEDADKAGGVASIETRNPDGSVSSVKGNQGAANNMYDPSKREKLHQNGAVGPDRTGQGNIFDTENYLKKLRSKYDSVDDYYSDSMSGMWDNLNPTDRKILLADQIGTMIRNIGKSRLPMYSAYGQNYAGKDFGDEKSLLQQGLESSFKSGLARRDTRLNNQLKQQLKVANFPSDLQMSIEEALASGRVSNKLKMEMLDIIGDVSIPQAIKIGLIQNMLGGSPTGGLKVGLPGGFSIGG